MALAVVQKLATPFIDYTGTGYSTKTVSLPGNWTSGNLLLGLATWQDTGFADINCTVSDAAGNTYAAQTRYASDGVSGGSQFSRWFICKQLAGTPAAGITFNFSGGNATSIVLEAWEISGQDTTTQPDVAVVNNSDTNVPATTDAITSGALTPVTDNCLLFCEATDYFESLSAGQLSAGSGWTIDAIASTGAPSPVHASARLQQGAKAAKAGLFTSAGANETWNTSVIAIRPAATGYTNVFVGRLGGPLRGRLG